MEKYPAKSLKLLCEQAHNKLYLNLESGDYIVLFEADNIKPTEITKSKVLCQRVTKWFTPSQVRYAKATIHAMKYVDKRFK